MLGVFPNDNYGHLFMIFMIIQIPLTGLNSTRSLYRASVGGHDDLHVSSV